MVCFASSMSSMWWIRSVHAFFYVESIQSHQGWRCCIYLIWENCAWITKQTLSADCYHCSIRDELSPLPPRRPRALQCQCAVSWHGFPTCNPESKCQHELWSRSRSIEFITWRRQIREWANAGPTWTPSHADPTRFHRRRAKDGSGTFPQSIASCSWPKIQWSNIKVWSINLDSNHFGLACKRFPMRSMARLPISFQGWGGYMKAAFWICSVISSSSLKGKVPERLTCKS